MAHAKLPTNEKYLAWFMQPSRSEKSALHEPCNLPEARGVTCMAHARHFSDILLLAWTMQAIFDSRWHLHGSCKHAELPNCITNVTFFFGMQLYIYSFLCDSEYIEQNIYCSSSIIRFLFFNSFFSPIIRFLKNEIKKLISASTPLRTFL